MVDVRTNAANRLLHPYWRGYEARTWAANWHQLFTDTTVFPDDDRSALTWRSRFATVAPVLYNFWSSGDEVLEIATTDINLTSGIEWDWSFNDSLINARRFVWHKQALFKGRSWLYGTRWAGWGFWEKMLPLIGKFYSLEEANALDDDTLRVEPVFRHNPGAMFSSNIVESEQNNLLARGIPELSHPIGYTNIVSMPSTHNIDMHTSLRREDKTWPQRDIDFNDKGQRPNRWLHTDLINLPHYFTHKLYRQLVIQGDMR
jgi:hypothetical protein